MGVSLCLILWAFSGNVRDVVLSWRLELWFGLIMDNKVTGGVAWAETSPPVVLFSEV